MNMYLFHNTYGDADSLIENKPEGVTCVPWGWDKDTEERRDAFLTLLAVNVPSLPAVVAWRKEYTTTSPNPLDPPKFIPSHWEVIKLSEVPRADWNWQYIQSVIDKWGDELDYL